MVGHKLLLIPLFIWVAAAGQFGQLAASAVARATACAPIQVAAGTCQVVSNVTASGVQLGLSTSTQNLPGSSRSHPRVFASKKPEPPTDPALIAPEASNDLGVIYNAPSAVTVSDLVNFSPMAAVAHVEPNGWAVIGLDTNFYATVGTEIKNGTLLGQSASVRFIPIGWQWSYGDGTSAAPRSAGATWKSQNLKDFDPTPTSHIYRKAGAYTAKLTVEFGAEYQFAAGPWLPVAGSISLPASSLRLTVGSAKTVLVSHDCTENPNGPGC